MKKPWIDFVPMDLAWQSGVSADIGCGSKPRNPIRCKKLIGVDLFPSRKADTAQFVSYIQTRQGASLPIESESLDFCSAFDFLEHLPRHSVDAGGAPVNSFIGMMNEIHRILKPGGFFLAVTPCFPSAATFSDPTHVNPITTETVDYFSGPTHAKELGYGFNGEFEQVFLGWVSLSNPLWETVDDGTRELSPHWGQRRPRYGLSRVREILGLAIRSLGVRRGPTPVHYLWVLKKPA